MLDLSAKYNELQQSSLLDCGNSMEHVKKIWKQKD